MRVSAALTLQSCKHIQWFGPRVEFSRTSIDFKIFKKLEERDIVMDKEIKRIHNAKDPSKAHARVCMHKHHAYILQLGKFGKHQLRKKLACQNESQRKIHEVL
jgi:hypothetical protein